MPVKKTLAPSPQKLRKMTDPTAPTLPRTDQETRPKVDSVALAKQARALRTQHQPPTPVVVSKATRYLIEFEDGTALCGTGELADVVYRYMRECERTCATQGLVYYGGPRLPRLTADELKAHLGR